LIAREPANTPPDPAAPPLRLLFWETTAACNLACVHCRRLDASNQLSRDDLTTEQAATMIRSLPDLGRPILVFSGGEPLMRPDLLELAGIAREVGLPTALATNGTIMDDRLARRIVEAGIRRTSMSFDGPTPAIHDRFRGIDGSFEATRRGFATLRDAGMSMQINTSVARHNFQHLDAMYDLALAMGADALHIFMLVPVGCGMALGDEIMLAPDEYEAALHWIYDRQQEGRLQLKATCAPHYFRVKTQRDVAAGAKPQAATSGGAMHAMTKGCLAGQSVCFVSHTGEVFPCGYLPATSGNVKATALPEIWRDSSVFADLRDDRQLAGKCGVCEFKKVCMGCRARAFAESHDYLAEEPNCGFIPTRLR